jgi:streptogramin lyase
VVDQAELRARAIIGRLLGALLIVAATVGTNIGSPTSRAAADTARIQEFPVPTPSSFPSDIARGPDGNLWFTENLANKIGRITLAGVITEFSLDGVGQSPASITPGADGNMWFLNLDNSGNGAIGRINHRGVVTEFPVPSVSSQQSVYAGITKGPDGNVWYADPVHDVIGRITRTGQTQEFVVPGHGTSEGPTDITTGADGSLWFGLNNQPLIGRIAPDFSGYTEFRIPSFQQSSFPDGAITALTTGPDGNVWFTRLLNQVGRVTPDGSFAEFLVPTPGGNPQDITAGPDGNLWFTESAGNRVGRVTPAGVFAEVLLPHDLSWPQGITTGPDGKVWFAEQIGDRIGNVAPVSLVSPPGPCLVVHHSLVLTRDVGPCRGDGIVVRGSHLTLDLNGHKIFAAHGPRVGDFAGIHLDNAFSVTLKHGEVTGFDAGVWLDGGAANIVTGLNVHDNVGAPEQASKLGDGIVLFHSAGNRLTDNNLTRNGVFDGIGVLGLGSSYNTIASNRIQQTTNRAVAPGNNPGAGSGIIINSFLEPEALGRGQSLTSNNVISNLVRDNVGDGISNVANDSAEIRGNIVDHNGFFPDGTRNAAAGNGIGVDANQNATPLTADRVVANRVSNNSSDGIVVFMNGNIVRLNRVIGNLFGVVDNGGHSNAFTRNVATGNQESDLADFANFNPPCDSNTWSGNTYGTATPDCTAQDGHHVGPSSPLPAPDGLGTGATQSRPASSGRGLSTLSTSGYSNRPLRANHDQVPGLTHTVT